MIFTKISPQTDRSEGRLLGLAALALCLYALILTLSPAVRERSWSVSYRWDHWLGVVIWLIIFGLAHLRISSSLPNHDTYLLPAASLLVGWGMLTVWRLVPSLGLRQSVWVLVAGVVLILGLQLPSDLGFLRRYKYLWLAGSLLLTAATLFFGTNPLGYGPRMWLGCCGLYLQPSEPLKLLFIAYLAAYMADREPYLVLSRLRIRALTQEQSSADRGSLLTFPLMRVIAPTLLVIGLALILLIVQRDLGTASIFIFLYASVVYLATGHRRFLWILALALIIAGVMGYYLFEIVRVRVDAWLNPWLDPSGGSYQLVQSLISMASGGLFGRGPGVGNPGLVPVAHSDLIYAAIVEEGGLVVAAGLLALIALLAGRGLLIALRSTNAYHRYLAAGLSVYLAGQSLLIIGGSLRLWPLTGVTLPFVSYGGSSLLTCMLSLLILLHISQKNQLQTEITRVPRSTYTYVRISTVLFLGLFIAALATGWWAVYRSSELQARTDNPRRSIADRSVRRGDLLDRQNKPLHITTGASGDYQRLSLYPQWGNVLGYNSPIYGQSGLEASLDGYLRGLQGYDPLIVWWNQLLYGQPPPGSDVRLTLDVSLQNRADEYLQGQTGALVILDAGTGEILAMASLPSFDPNTIEADWEELVEAAQSPLINRASQGQYSPGAALGALLTARAVGSGEMPPLPAEMRVVIDGYSLECAIPLTEPTWKQAINSGCPGAVATLGEIIGTPALQDYFQSLGLYQAPNLRMPVVEQGQLPEIQDAALNALGAGMQVSPLQMALASAILSTEGIMPAPRVALAADIPGRGSETIVPLDSEKLVLPHDAVAAANELLTATEFPIWEVVSFAPAGTDRSLTWYIAGAVPGLGEPPVVLVLLLEDKNPTLAKQIGIDLLKQALTSR